MVFFRTFFGILIYMSGHSKWSTIKRKKGAADAKRGQAFSKFARMITIAAKEGGIDPEMNFKLRLAIDKAKQINMPLATIERAISGASKDGANIEEIIYEGYGPEKVALLIKTVTDNKNRASADVKAVLAKHNGSLGGPGSVSWMFEPKGLIIINSKDFSSNKKEELELLAIDLGADDLKEEDDMVEVYINPAELHKIAKLLKKEGYKLEEIVFEMKPQNLVKITDKDKALKVIKLVDALEELEDVEEVFSNFDIDSKVLKEL